MTAKEILRLAKVKIADPGHWCQRYYAFDGSSNSCCSWSPEAVKWCARGACNAVTFALRDSYPSEIEIAETALSTVAWPSGLAAFNDNHTHADVLALYDRAIEAA